MKLMEQKRETPERITELAENEIFVFGSNLEGAHGGGAALRDQGERDPERFLPVRRVIAAHVAGLQALDDLLCQKLVSFCQVFVHGDSSVSVFSRVRIRPRISSSSARRS